MKIREIMTAQPIIISPDATLTEAARLMVERGVAALPVCRGRSVVGMITERDIVVRSTAEGHHPDNHTVAAIMDDQVAHIYADQDVQEAAWLMEIKRTSRLTVVDPEQQQLIGIITLTDLCAHGADRMLSAEVLEHLCEPRRTADPYLHPAAAESKDSWTFSRL